MNLKNKLISLFAVLLCAGNAWSYQESSLFLRSEQVKRDHAVRGSKVNDGQLSDDDSMINGKPRVDAGQVSWTIVEKTEVKGVKVHDLVTILVREKSSHGTESENKSDKDQSVNMVLSDWLSLSNGDLRPATQRSGDPRIGANMSRTFDGQSEITREDYLTAEIQAEVVDVYPNGNLVLEANHYIKTDEETTTITLTGMCRSNDISTQNTILSSKIANLKIDKQHSGMARDYTKRGWLVKLLGAINPF
ncbi:MAG: flagellar basal body L-ring protein FlgH [Sedimentisphaerales bacterium]|nr:flagellar basal body L-ring protein FlgH [Sedimentisphaerales bacterium]MBN2843047.1 flagellar basal body L-ring protein FlgH [Sedimentisphaerales bacterium]